MCFFPESTRRFSSQNGEKTVKKTGPIIWTKMSLQRSSLLVLLNIFLSFFFLCFPLMCKVFIIYYLFIFQELCNVLFPTNLTSDFSFFFFFLFFLKKIFFFLLHLFWVLYIYIYIYINGMSIHSSIHNFFNKNIVYYFLFFIGNVSKFI